MQLNITIILYLKLYRIIYIIIDIIFINYIIFDIKYNYLLQVINYIYFLHYLLLKNN